MAINASAVWRVRPSGVNTNGGGFDTSISSSTGSLGVGVTGSHGSWSTTGGTTTFTDATASAFIAGMATSPGTSINISGVGQFLIRSYVSATQITIQTPNPATSNFGNAANWTIGSGLDYTQQNSAQASGTNGSNVGTTFTDATALAFTAAMVGNAMWITSAGGATAGPYFITAYTSSSVVTLDRTPGTTITGMHWAVGGGWADFTTNTTANIVPGNIIYILGGASPSYGSPDYTISTYHTLVSGNATAGNISIFGDPGTPSTNGYGGYPLIKLYAALLYNCGYFNISSLFMFLGANAPNGTIFVTMVAVEIRNVVLDQNGYDGGMGAFASATNIEVFSSVGKRGTNANYGLVITYYSASTGCNIHDCIGPAVSMTYSSKMTGSIIAKNGGAGVTISGSSAGFIIDVTGNTIDGNSGSAIVLSAQVDVLCSRILNNIISNHTTGGTYGITVSAGTQLANDLVKTVMVDYNTFYNNTTNYNAISPSAHDTVLSSSPYVAQSTENYTLA